MTLTLELAILLVKTRQVIVYALWFLVLVLAVDTCVVIVRNTLFVHKGLKRKIILSVIVILLTGIRIMVEIAAGLNIWDSLLVLVLMFIYAIQLVFFKRKTRKKIKK